MTTSTRPFGTASLQIDAELETAKITARRLTWFT